MRTLKTLKPGQKGTQELLARFGPSLLRVRYRYDDTTHERLKTVELVVQRHASEEPEAQCAHSRPKAAAADTPRRCQAQRPEQHQQSTTRRVCAIVS